MSVQLYDVAVIGAGPAGSRVAYKLAHAGHKVVVLEQRAKVGEKPCCSGIISHECAETFNVDKSVILRAAKSAVFLSPSRDSLRLSRPEAVAYIVNRSAFDISIACQAQNAGAEYYLSTRCENIIHSGDGVIIEAVRDWTSLRFNARAAVIAAGFGSSIVKKLRLGKLDGYAAGAQAEVVTRDVDDVQVYFGNGASPGFFAWLVPTTPGKGLAGLFSRRIPGAYLKKFLSWLAAQGKIESADVDIRHGGVPLKPISRSFGDRFLVVGDAAGQVKPTTGGGIYFGLLCADIAAGTLDKSLRTGDLSARSLSSYEREWHKKLGRELAIDRFARVFYESLNDRQINRLFDIIKNDGIGEAIINGSISFDWHGDLILKALRHNTVTNAICLMKLPFALMRR